MHGRRLEIDEGCVLRTQALHAKSSSNVGLERGYILRVFDAEGTTTGGEGGLSGETGDFPVRRSARSAGTRTTCPQGRAGTVLAGRSSYSAGSRDRGRVGPLEGRRAASGPAGISRRAGDPRARAPLVPSASPFDPVAESVSTR